MVCQIRTFVVVGGMMKVLSRWMELMPMMAGASLTLRPKRLAEPIRVGSGWSSRFKWGHKSLVAAHNDHDEQVGNHDHINECQHHQHDDGFIEAGDLAESFCSQCLDHNSSSACWLPNAASIR